MYLLAPFILQNFKKFLGAIQGYKDVLFLVRTIIFTFIYLLAIFIVQNFKKILTANPELWGCIIFGPQMGFIFPKQTFSHEKIFIIFIYLLSPFILQNFKKILKAKSDLWGCDIFGSKIP